LGTQAAVAIEKAQLLRSEREQRQEVDFLYKVSQKLSGYLDSGKMIEQFLDLLCETFDYYRIRVFLIDDESGSLMLTNARGEEESTGINSESGRLQEDSVLNQVVLSLQPMVIPAGEIPEIVQREAQASSAPARLVIPIKSGGPVLGVLDIHHRARREFSSREVQLMQTVSDQLAAAVEKAMLYAELQAALQQEKAARTQLVQAEKLAALGRIVASVAHELNNPLQAIQNALYLIKLEESLPSQAREDLQTVLNEADRMAGLISRLREAYRPAVKEEFQIESLNVLVTEVQRLLSTHLRHNQIEFEFQPDDRLPKIPMIRDQIKQVILNVSLNAVEAMSEGGYITVRTWHETKAKSVVLSIADTGPSIGADILPYIFDPFITTKEGGTGLGLAITYDIVRRHNGRIEVESGLGKGTIFKVWLPLKQGFERESQARSITGIGKK
jgi:signal transduction histidine kinase